MNQGNSLAINVAGELVKHFKENSLIEHRKLDETSLIIQEAKEKLEEVLECENEVQKTICRLLGTMNVDETQGDQCKVKNGKERKSKSVFSNIKEKLVIKLGKEWEQKVLNALTRDKLCLCFLNMVQGEHFEFIQKPEVLKNIETYYKLTEGLKRTGTQSRQNLESFVSDRLEMCKDEPGVTALYKSLWQIVENFATFADLAEATLCYLATKQNAPIVLKETEKKLSEQINAFTETFLRSQLEKYLTSQKEQKERVDSEHGAFKHPKYQSTVTFQKQMTWHLTKAPSNSLHAHFAVVYEFLSENAPDSKTLNKDFYKLGECRDKRTRVDMEYDYFQEVFQIVQTREALRALIAKHGLPLPRSA